MTGQEDRRSPVQEGHWLHDPVTGAPYEFVPPPKADAEICNHTEDGEPYCGQPDCDIDFCQDCGEEYFEPCTRHEGVDHG